MVKEARRKTSLADEATTGKMVREESTRDIQRVYPLLLKGLDLTASENEALLAFLIEDLIAKTRTRYASGVGMDEHERSNRIAAIIGDSKLQQFLALERNLGEYGEVQYVQSMLQQKGVPFTDTQQDRLLKILIDTREQVDMKRPAHIKRRSIKSLEHKLNQLDEYERLVLELAPSVLSSRQVQYLFERYQALSYKRFNALVTQKRARSDDPTGEHLPLHYPPRK